MLQKARHRFLPLALVLPLVGCGGAQIELQHSEELEALLPAPSDYPDGFDVETVDITELDDSGGSGTSDFDSIEPTVCEEALEGGPGDVPEEAAEGAGQTLTPSGEETNSVYVYFLTTGDFEENAQDRAAYETMLDSCSSMTVVEDDMEMEAGISPAHSPALPEGGEGFTMELSSEGFAMVMRVGWGQVEDVHFVLVGMSAGTEAEVSPSTLADECELGDAQCRDRVQEEAQNEAQEELEVEFDEVLAAGMEILQEQA